MDSTSNAAPPALSRRYAPYDLRSRKRRIKRAPSYSEDIISISERLSRPLFGLSSTNPDNDAFSVPWRTVSRETAELREQFYLEKLQKHREEEEKIRMEKEAERKAYESVFETARVIAERRASANPDVPNVPEKVEGKGKEVEQRVEAVDDTKADVAQEATNDDDEEEDADYSPDAEAQDDEEEDILLTEIEPIDEAEEVMEGVPSPITEHAPLEPAAEVMAEHSGEQSARSQSIEVSEAASSGDETEAIEEDVAVSEEQSSAAVSGEEAEEEEEEIEEVNEEGEVVPEIRIQVVREYEEAEEDEEAGETSDEADVDSDQATEEIRVMEATDEYSDGNTDQAQAQPESSRTHSWWSLSSPRILRSLLATKQAPEESVIADENTEPSSPVRAQAQVQSLRRLPLTSTVPQTPLPYSPASFIDVSDGSCATDAGARRSIRAKEWPGLRHSGSLIPSYRSSVAATPRQAQTPRVTAAALGLAARRSVARGHAKPPRKRTCLYYGAGYGSQSTPYSSTVTVVHSTPSATAAAAQRDVAAGKGAAGGVSRSSITAQKILDIIGEVPPGRAQTTDTRAFVNPYELSSPYAVRMRPATPQRRRELVPVSLRLSRSSVTPAKPTTTSSTAKAATKGSVLDSIASAAPPAIQAKLAATQTAKQPMSLPAAAAKQAALGAKDTNLPAFAFALSNASASPPPITVGAMAVEPARLPSFGFDLARKPQPAFTATPSKSQGTANNTWSQNVFASAAPKSGEWTCDICELKNPDSATKCTVCDAAKPAPTTTTLSASSSWSQNVFATTAAKNGEWTCDVCELKNADSAAKCTVCDAARPASMSAALAPAAPVKNSWSQSVLSSVSSKSGEWTCDVCELKNPDSAAKCTVCDAQRPGAQASTSVSASASASASTPTPAPASSWSASLLAAAAPKNGEWTCGTCELKNPGFSSQCTVCDTPKPASSDNSASQSSAKQKASTLTPFELPAFAFDLDVSSKPLFPGAVRPSEWTCTVCELKNPDSAMQCTICDAPR